MKTIKSMRVYSSLITQVTSIITISIGVIVLTGWVFNIPIFRSIIPGFGDMKLITSYCFILSGCALFLLNRNVPLKSWLKRIGFICSWVVLLIGLFSLLLYLFRWNLNIDRLPMKWKPAIISSHLLRQMNFYVSFNFTLLGIIFLIPDRMKYNWIKKAAFVAIIPGTLLVIINHIFGISFLSAIPLNAPSSFLTAILFILLAIGIFHSSEIGFLKLSFIQKIAGFFALILLLRSLVFFAIDKNNKLVTETAKNEEHVHEVLFLAEQVNFLSDEIESIERGYLISKNDIYSSLLNRRSISIHKMIDQLSELTLNNEDEQLKLDTAKRLLNSYLTFQSNLITIRKNNGFDSAQKMMLAGSGELLLAKIHSIINSIVLKENQDLSIRKAANKLIVENSTRIFTIFQAIAFFLFLWALKMIYTNSKLRNNFEEELEKSLKEISDYKYAIDESSILVITDQSGIIKQVNDNFCKISKYTKEELIGKDHRIINAGYHSKEFIRDLWKSISKGNIWRGEIKNKARDGSYFWLDTTIVPFMNEQGKPYQYVAIRSDITQRKLLQEEIVRINKDLQNRVQEKTSEVIEKEQKYRFLLQNMREGIQIIGYDWTYIFVNNSILNQSEYSKEELVGHTIFEKYPGIENTRYFKVLQRCMNDRNPEILEDEFSFPDGTKRSFELSIQPVLEGLFILSMDITERKKAEEKLQESLERYELVNKATRDTIWEWDMNTNEVTRNETFTKLYGYANNQFINNQDGIWEKIHPLDRDRILKNIDNCIKEGLEYWQDEYRFRAKDGSYKYVYDRAFLHFGDDGKPYRMVGAMTDLTEKKKLEKELTEQRLRQQKLIMEVAIQSQEKEKSELGKELHDNINQILATVKIYLGMAKSGESISEENLIEKSYEYVNLAMEELRKLSHSLVAPSLGEIGLQEALQDLVADTKLINNLKVQLQVDENYKNYEIDKNIELMLFRIVQEQYNNITKYSEASLVIISLKIDNSCILLSITDNGVGFDTAKKANGIGLKNISNRVEFYSGNMNIQSAPGKGCSLEVSIPLNSAL